jgi:hypothetical protein
VKTIIRYYIKTGRLSKDSEVLDEYLIMLLNTIYGIFPLFECGIIIGVFFNLTNIIRPLKYEVKSLFLTLLMAQHHILYEMKFIYDSGYI